MKSFLGIILVILTVSVSFAQQSGINPVKKYTNLQDEFAAGWNTWNHRSLLSHVLLPHGFALNLGFKDYLNREVLTESVVGTGPAIVRVGAHAWDGSYTSLDIRWTELQFRIESAHQNDDLVILVTPLQVERLKTPLLLVQGGAIWNRKGTVTRMENVLTGHFQGQDINVYTTAKHIDEYFTGGMLSPYITAKLDGDIGVSTGKERDLASIKSIIKQNKQKWLAEKAKYDDMSDVFFAMQSVLAWNTTFDPQNNRVISPVSRKWSISNRGYVIYLWDTYFAAYQTAAFGQKQYAYANAVEMTRAKGDLPFVPNVEQANGFKSRDRSQPPVGCVAVREIYRKFKDKWFLQLLYADLLEWNNWWHENRDYDGLLCYGSTPYEPVVGFWAELRDREQVNGWFGASMESGWDGATLYKDVPFDKERHILTMWDVALNGLYVMDCRALADIAEELGKKQDASLLRERAKSYQINMQRLWDDETGFFRNKSWITGEFSEVTAINGFYAMLAKAATEEQVKTILKNYFFNEDEFYTRWIIPTIAKSHAAFNEQDLYWDGKVWPPVNFLVYLGLRNYDFRAANETRKILVQKSKDLLLLDWNKRRYVRENYDTTTGQGEIENKSDAFYHWGGLLGLMSLVEEGFIGAPDQSM